MKLKNSLQLFIPTPNHGLLPEESQQQCHFLLHKNFTLHAKERSQAFPFLKLLLGGLGLKMEHTDELYLFL